MSSEHKERVAKIFAGVLPPRGTAAHEAITRRIQKLSTPETKKHAAQMLEVFVSTCFAISKNGIGFPIDALLRYYIQEFNHRAATAGMYSMPTSFSFMEAFMDFRRPIFIFLPKQENNRLCSFSDFLDWTTSADQAPDPSTLKNSIESNRIHFFSNTSNPDLLKFRCSNGVDISILSAAIVRDRNEIVVVLQISESEAGEDMRLDWAEAKRRLKEVDPFAAAQKEKLKLSTDWTHGRVTPKGLTAGYESVAMMRFDIEKQAIVDRGLYQDWGDSYRTFVDVVQAFGAKDFESLTEDQRKVYESSVNTCNKYQEIFELCRHFALLPLFSASYAAHTRHFEQPTELRAATTGLKEKKLLEKAIDETKVYVRSVQQINAPKDEITGRLIVKIPGYTYEDSGYWKMLSPWELGVDKHGLPEQGRTWVTQDRPTRAARSAYELRPSRNIDPSPADQTRSTFGYIYVMRSAQHEKDVFKIGLTTRDPATRARELTANTSSVDQFGVMQQWEVSDCHKAEAEIHMQLEPFRVNKKREFFKCDYRQIFGVIHEVVEKINVSP